MDIFGAPWHSIGQSEDVIDGVIDLLPELTGIGLIP
jgi:hypothetical protein